MADEDDTFDLDIYGDGDEATADNQDLISFDDQGNESYTDDNTLQTLPDRKYEQSETEAFEQSGSRNAPDPQIDALKLNSQTNNSLEQTEASTETPNMGPELLRQDPVQQGVKRKESSDDRPIDQGASTAFVVNDLHWWITEDDIRGWANQCECEDELVAINFSEHKVNGKSKGAAYVDFLSPQAATAVKHKIESFANDGNKKNANFPVAYHRSGDNPFKSQVKDASMRGGRESGSRGDFRGRGGAYNEFRGGRGSFNRGRGNFNNQINSNNNVPLGNFGGPGGFGGPMGGFNNFGRGNMMMRGGMPGRGGFGMPMGMGMPGFPMNMMGGMTGQQGGHFNPAFFQNQPMDQQLGNGGDNWNPHGSKRPRQNE